MVSGRQRVRRLSVNHVLLSAVPRRAVAAVRTALARLGSRTLTTLVLSLFIGVLLSPGVTRSVPRYTLGQFTTSAVRAPYDFAVTDEAANARRREEAARLVPPVAVLDTAVVQRIVAEVGAAFGDARAVFDEADRLRAVPDEELNRLSARQRSALRDTRAREADGFLDDRLPGTVVAFERAIGVSLTPGQREILVRGRFGSPLVDGLIAILSDAYRQPITEDLGTLRRVVVGDLETKDGPGRLAIRNSATGAEQLVALPLPIREPSQVLDDLPSRVELLAAGFDPEERALLAQLAAAQIRANLVLDSSTTGARRTAASAAVMPVSLHFRRNQLIIGEGQEVTAQTLVALDYLRARGVPSAYVRRLVGAAGFVFLLVTVAFWVADRVARQTLLQRDDFTYIATALALAALIFWLWRAAVDGLVPEEAGIPEMALVLAFPFATVGMLTRFTLGYEAALVHLLIASVIYGLLSELGVPLVAFSLTVGLAGAHWVSGCTRRSCVLGAGLLVGLVSAAGGLCLFLLSGSGWQTGPAVLVAAGAVLGGLLTGPAVVALSPVVEWAFGHTTKITLLEMVSYEHPLLKRIMTETPGTFQHSLGVSTLADAAASAIGADALLSRVGSLYHDVGKIENPGFFVENQTGPNEHDRLTPQESARVIRAHVTDGVTLVQAHRLGARIAGFVREHHGSSTATYFLAKARERLETPNEDDFRYPGPPPSSRETAVVMIADQVEAIGRTMRGSPPEQYQAMVHGTIDRIRQSGQLNRCPLTLHELSVIEEAMVAVLVGMNHRRVDYPGQAAPPIPGERAQTR